MAKVYVGTYRKYNNGNLDGKWMTLEDYSSFKEFINACCEVHKDESDPELMIQDTEDFPDGLGCGEWLSEEDFNDVIKAIKEGNEEEESKYQIIDYSEKAIAVVGDTREIKDELKKLGGRFNPRLSCGAGWVFSKKVQEQLQELLRCGKVTESVAKVQVEANKYKETLAEYIANCQRGWDADYAKKYYIGAIKINGSYLTIGKGHIENEFWFGDEGIYLEHYKEVTETEETKKAYFKASNLAGINRDIERLQEDDRNVYISKVDNPHKNEVYWYTNEYAWEEKQRESDVLATKEQKEEIIKMLEWKKAQFEKRIDTYLKKYGVSKVRFGTYWMDR